MRRRCWPRRWRRSLWIEFLYADLWYVIIIIMFVTHDWRIISRLYPDAARMKTKPPKNPGEKTKHQVIYGSSIKNSPRW